MACDLSCDGCNAAGVDNCIACAPLFADPGSGFCMPTCTDP